MERRFIANRNKCVHSGARFVANTTVTLALVRGFPNCNKYFHSGTRFVANANATVTLAME
jgi:hypothetical protein